MSALSEIGAGSSGIAGGRMVTAKGSAQRLSPIKYDFCKEAFVTDRDKVFGWFNGIFRLMPIPLSRMLGTLLYRHLS